MKQDVSRTNEFRKYYLSEFELYDGEEFITFNIVHIDTEKMEIQVAVTDRGKIGPITYDLIADLKKYEDWFRLADDNFDNKRNEYYLAVNVEREPLYPQCLASWLKDFETDNGLKRVTIHGLRHTTYCSLLLSQNIPLQTVAKYMGHSDSTITLKVYSHFIADTQELVISTLDNILKKNDE